MATSTCKNNKICSNQLDVNNTKLTDFLEKKSFYSWHKCIDLFFLAVIEILMKIERPPMKQPHMQIVACVFWLFQLAYFLVLLCF